MDLESVLSDDDAWSDAPSSPPMADNLLDAAAEPEMSAPPAPMAEAALAAGSQRWLPPMDGGPAQSPSITATDDIPVSLRNPERDAEAPRVEGNALPTVEAASGSDVWARRGFELLREIQRAHPPHDPSALDALAAPGTGVGPVRGAEGGLPSFLDPSAAPTPTAALLASAIPALFQGTPDGDESHDREA